MAFDEIMDSEQRFQFLLRESEAADDPDRFAELMVTCLAVRSTDDIANLIKVCLTEHHPHTSDMAVIEGLGLMTDSDDAGLVACYWAFGIATPTPGIRRKVVAALRTLPKPEIARP